jgi:hypothetical protein
MDKILTTGSYGICLFSLNPLQDYLKGKAVRSKKLLNKFQKDQDFYLEAIKDGVWLPFAGINSIKYMIKLDGYDTPFSDEWEQKIEYGGFNLAIEDSIWISDIGSFYTFDKEKYKESDLISYQAENNFGKITIYSDFRYDMPSGKYMVSVKGFARKEKLKYPEANCGFFFSLVKVKEFEGFNNPREQELYDFNVANM